MKTHNSGNRKIIALCDDDIKGQIFRENGLQLDLSSDFYNGEIRDESFILSELKNTHIINAVGKECIGFLLKHKLIEKDNIRTIAKIPYSQCIIQNV